jgi:hypothetical protein
MTQLGWRPRWEQQMLERTIEWYKTFYDEGRLLSVEQLDDYQRELEPVA